MRSAVDGTAVLFADWLKTSKLPFFTDYTDHGIEHVTEVINASVELIRPAAKKIFTAEDAAVLILAVLLHDSALHLSEAGFRELIQGSAAQQRIKDFDAAAWPDLWRKFLYAAMRWDHRKLIEVFGASPSGSPRGVVRDPFDHYDNLTDTDRKLIGEFIRQNHPRLAHEFAVFGVPGPSSSRIVPDPLFGKEKLDIAGLVARSHGLPLRKCVDYLKEHYHRREYQKVHPVFLMTLLRVSDYLQIQAGRAPEIVFRYRTIASPLSVQEWKTHQAVTNITVEGVDPEAIEIQAKPEDVWTFLRLKEWITGIQAELDASWSVLGEVYGASKLAALGLKYRRVRSNLDDVAKFAGNVDYVPGRVEFDIARAELLNLLVQPLYGDNPEVGIRELMQNAVDAVRELAVWLAARPDPPAPPGPRQSGDVEIWLDEPDESGRAWLTVNDRGIGMTVEVIRDYFLKIGSSFRDSMAWREAFETHGGETGVDGHPRSRVLRSGRFGVGALATFLLGNEIEVRTRHVTAERGVRFTARLASDPIQLTYDNTLEVGTTIRVAVSREVHDKLAEHTWEWDWYCLAEPRVIRCLGRTKQLLAQERMIPDLRRQRPPGWHAVPAPGFDAVYVDTWNSQSGGRVGWLICNGIKVAASNALNGIDYWSRNYLFPVTTPAIVVFDPDGKLPLNLQRSELTAPLPFLAEAYSVTVMSLLADLLVNTPDAGPLGRQLDYLSNRFWDSNRDMGLRPFFSTREGVAPLTPWNLLNAGARRCLVLLTAGPDPLGRVVPHHSYDAVLRVEPYNDSGLGSVSELLVGGTQTRNHDALNDLPMRGTRLLTTVEGAHGIMNQAAVHPHLFHDVREEWSNGEWTTLTTGICEKTCFDLGSLPPTESSPYAPLPPMAAEWFLEERQPQLKLVGLSKVWNEIIRHPVIPFAPEARKATLAHAYEVLRPFLDDLALARASAEHAPRGTG